MARRSSSPTLLTNLELEVMQVVWRSPEPANVREVMDIVNQDRSRPLAYNTLQTMLTILRDKGVVVAEPGPGRAHVFRARLSRKEVTTHMVGDLVQRLFEGESKPLLLHLMDQENLSRDELRELRDAVERQLDDGEAPA